MPDLDSHDPKVSRREVLGISSAAFAATLAVAGGNNADAQTQRLHNHNAPNETDPGPQNLPLASENPDSEWSPSTDSGTVKPFKYSFSLARKRVESGGWTR
jgi:oxalate decarboxylase